MDVYIASEPFRGIFLLRKKTTWYSAADGNWTDPHTWMSNKLDRKLITSPQPGDDVYISHNVVFDTAITSTTNINNLNISGKLSWGNHDNTLVVNGELICTGTLDQSTVTNATIILRGYNTTLTTYITNSTSTVHYASYYLYTQKIAAVTYQNLSLYSLTNPVDNANNFNNTKYLTADLLVNGSFVPFCKLDTMGFNATFNGTTMTNVGNGGTTTFISNASILFVGQIVSGGGGPISLSGTASIEVRGGISANGVIDFSTATIVNFTTNNQTVNSNGYLNLNNPTVVGAITVTNTGGAIGDPGFSPAVNVIGTLNGTVSGSTWNNSGTLQFNNVNTVMSTGVFNYNNSGTANIIYQLSTTSTLPRTTYYNLAIFGTGNITFSGNVTFNNYTQNGCTVDFVSNNATFNGVTIVKNAASTFKKTGAGSMLFVGLFNPQSGSNIDCSGGNPSIEFRGGITFGATSSSKLGGGAITFTTNNQTIQSVALITTSLFTGSITISSGVTVTATNNSNLQISATLNGADATSIFNNSTNSTINYQNATAPMITGKLYCNQAANTFIYGGATNQDIQVLSDPINPGYYNLTLNGGAFAKRLLGNVSVKNTYTLTSPTTLNSNGFSLTNP